MGVAPHKLFTLQFAPSDKQSIGCYPKDPEPMAPHLVGNKWLIATISPESGKRKSKSQHVRQTQKSQRFRIKSWFWEIFGSPWESHLFFETSDTPSRELKLNTFLSRGTPQILQPQVCIAGVEVAFCTPKKWQPFRGPCDQSVSALSSRLRLMEMEHTKWVPWGWRSPCILTIR